MRFELVRDSLIALLGAAQGTSWTTIGFIERDQSDKQNFQNRTVQLFFNSGQFPKSKSSFVGPIYNMMEFRLVFTVATASSGDVDAVENATTPAEYAAALATFTRSEEEADREMDDFISSVFSVLMAANNRQLGIPLVDPDTLLEVPPLSDRWIDTVRKEEPKQSGQFCTMRAQMILRAQIAEEIIGEDISGNPEYQVAPHDGTHVIKDNIPQSGELDAGIPVAIPIP